MILTLYHNYNVRITFYNNIQALKAGNLYDIIALARFMESDGHHQAASKLWFQASKLGHLEGQWKTGLASYYGSMGIAKDIERAYQLFTRVAKWLLNLVSKLPQKSMESKELIALNLPPLMEFQSCTDILRECTHILGILHLDGIATEQDLSTAIRWLRIAQSYGSEDAGKLLQSMFRSGMY